MGALWLILHISQYNEIRKIIGIITLEVEELYRSLFEIMRDGLLITDLETGRIPAAYLHFLAIARKIK